MGCFNYIDTSDLNLKCDICGDEISEFQSKDGPCDMTTIHWSEVDYFYTNCHGCGDHICYEKVKKDKIPSELFNHYYKKH